VSGNPRSRCPVGSVAFVWADNSGGAKLGTLKPGGRRITMDQAVKEAPRTELPVLPNHWNHANFSVPPERFREVEACFDALFDWEKYLNRDDIVGYRLVDNSREGAVYVRPTEAAGKI